MSSDSILRLYYLHFAGNLCNFGFEVVGCSKRTRPSSPLRFASGSWKAGSCTRTWKNFKIFEKTERRPEAFLLILCYSVYCPIPILNGAYDGWFSCTIYQLSDPFKVLLCLAHVLWRVTVCVTWCHMCDMHHTQVTTVSMMPSCGISLLVPHLTCSRKGPWCRLSGFAT